MSWKLEFTSRATKDLKKAERSVAERVYKTLKRLAEGDSSVDIRKLETRPGEVAASGRRMARHLHSGA
ncbi:MAG: type II toxin-antitoxin system RelE/ParE family toxin [Vulcanimicrobiota bacterium]